jgi:hypothetical protein
VELRQIKNPNLDPLQGDKSNPDPHHIDAVPQHWLWPYLYLYYDSPFGPLATLL